MINNENIGARISLKYYLDLIKENERLKEENKQLVNENYILLIERMLLKNIALRRSETSTIWRYDEFDLERITDAEDWAFGLRYHEKLLESGLTMEELVDYIKERREFYENEENRR